MLTDKTLHLVVCMVLYGSIAFAAQEPLTPEVTQENMLVPSGVARADGVQAKQSNAQENKTQVTPTSSPAAPANLPPVATSYKPTTPLPLVTEATGATGAKEEVESKATVNGSGHTKPRGVFIPVPPISPNLGQLTDLRGQLEMSKLRVAIAEQEARLRQINAPPAPVAPAMQAMPQIPLDMLLDSSRTSKAVKAAPFIAPPSRKIGVVSIQGVNGLLSATIATKSGTIIVKPGDSFGGGKIESIAYNQVLVRYAKKTAPIPFVE